MRSDNSCFSDWGLSTYRVSKKSLVILHNSHLNVLWVYPVRELLQAHILRVLCLAFGVRTFFFAWASWRCRRKFDCVSMRRLRRVLEVHLRDWSVWLVCAGGAHWLWTPLSAHVVHHEGAKVWLACLAPPRIGEFKVEIVFRWLGVLVRWQVIGLVCLFDFFRLTLLAGPVLWRAVVILEIKKVGALVQWLTFLLGLRPQNRARASCSCINLLRHIEVKQIVVRSSSSRRLVLDHVSNFKTLFFLFI